MPSSPNPSMPDSPFGLVVADPDTNTSVPRLWIDWLLFMVPLSIAEVRTLPAPEIDRIRSEASQLIASHGDDAQFGGAQRAKARIALAKGLAIPASSEGGVTALGIHACTRSHPNCPGPPLPTPTPQTLDAE